MALSCWVHLVGLYAPLLGTGYPAGSPWEGHQVPAVPARAHRLAKRDSDRPSTEAARRASDRGAPTAVDADVPQTKSTELPRVRTVPSAPLEGPLDSRSGSLGPPPRLTRRRLAGLIGPANSCWPEMESSCDVTFSDMGQGACQCFVFLPMRRRRALLAVHEYDSAHLATTHAEARKIPIKCSPGHGL